MKRNALFALALACATPADAATFILVHGAYQDGSVWDQVIRQLVAQGHTARAVTLPGHGKDRSDPASLTLARYRATVSSAVAKSQEPVILVGHGSSGVVISAVAEAMPQRIASLVYVSAYLPRDGQSIMALSLADTGKAITVQNWRTNAAKTTGEVLATERGAIFCGDCSTAYKDHITRHSRPEPLRPMSEAVRLTPKRFGSVSKAYVHTTLNRAISPAHQQAMANNPGIRNYSLRTSHSPFFTQPAELANILMAEGAR